MPSVDNHTGEARAAARYRLLLLSTSGCGGLLYGVDIGIVAAALLFVGHTIPLTVAQTSLIVAAVLAGGTLMSPIGGVLADWFGRKKMMVLAGLMFVSSIVLIVLSNSFMLLFAGRLLQGMSGGLIAVVVPLYLAECLDAGTRGRGTALFQFMLTVGIAIASVIGWYYTHGAQVAIAAAHGDPTLMHAAEAHAWRSMFLTVLYPGLAFFIGVLFLSESPRWLLRKGRVADAVRSLHRSAPGESLATEQVEAAVPENRGGPVVVQDAPALDGGTLWQRRYIIPFVIACVVLACNQATGINSILSFLVIILKHAGLTATHATQGDTAVKVLNCLVTIVAIALVDRKGRRFLLRLGTATVVVALAAAALLFYHFESTRQDATAAVTSARTGNTLHYAVSQLGGRNPVSLTVLYNYGDGTELATASQSDGQPLRLAPNDKQAGRPLSIEKAFTTEEPGPALGWAITACIGLFIAGFGVGPGVVVWLVLSELMPTRIRSRGMGIALLLNQGVSTLIAALFLPVVGRFGYFAIFAFWAACTVVYFLVAAFFLPETKGKTLEEIEILFAKPQTPVQRRL